MSPTALGAQTVRFTPRIRGKHNAYTDGPAKVYPGCSVQPDSSADRNEDGTEREARWKLYAPGDFPTALPEGVITVPGIWDPDRPGQLRRLHVVGELQAHVDLDGSVFYVGGSLADWSG